MRRVLICLAGTQGFAALVDNRAVPVRLPQHGQAEGHEMFTGVRGIDSFAHDFLQSKERRLFAAALVDSGIVNMIVKLSKDALHFFGDGQPEVSRILQQGYTLISFLMVNFSRRDLAIIESLDMKNNNELFQTPLNMKKSSQSTNFSVG